MVVAVKRCIEKDGRTSQETEGNVPFGPDAPKATQTLTAAKFDFIKIYFIKL